MFSKFQKAMGISLFFALLFVIPVFAGGWAIITLDDLPLNVKAGKPVKIGFMVLQHGQRPINGLEPTVTARLSLKDKIVVNAIPEGRSGHYTAMLIFPKEGNWEWSIQAFTMDQKMPALTVAASVVDVASQSSAKDESTTNPVPLLNIARSSVLGIGLAGLVFAIRRKSRFAIALTVVCLLIGVGSFVMVPAVPAVEAQGEALPKAINESSVSQVEIGRQLFIAKGCITCHFNDKATIDADMTILMDAPNLSKYSGSPEYLRMRLDDPASVKADTWMPDLNLSDAEIEALIAFINSK